MPASLRTYSTPPSDAAGREDFAILAKDNGTCWGGGRPDDITVIVSRVIDPTHAPTEEGGRTEESPPSFTAYTTGPGTPPPAITELPVLKDTL